MKLSLELSIFKINENLYSSLMRQNNKSQYNIRNEYISISMMGLKSIYTVTDIMIISLVNAKMKG